MSIDAAIRELRARNEPVPLPLRLPTEAEVAIAERAIGQPFPADYRRFLFEASDVAFGTLEPAVVTPDAGHLALTTVVRDARALGVSDDLLPFCEDNGDYYCLTRNGLVRFWSHNGLSHDSWPDLATWIRDVWLAESS